MDNKSEKGIALYLGLIIMTIILAVAFGLSTILISQVKMTKEIGDSIKALYAADSGIEQSLKMGINDLSDPAKIAELNQPNKFGDSYGYVVEITCCEVGAGSCDLVAAVPGIVCPVGLLADSDCTDGGASYFCYKSMGNYKGIKRAIETKR